MFRSRRKVKPEDNELESNSDSEGISSLAYALRGSKNSKISRICDKREILFIEKRFQDTAKIIFQQSKNPDHEFMDNWVQEVDEMNTLFLTNAYKADFRADIVAIGGRNIRPRKLHPKPNTPTRPVQTIDQVWDPSISNMTNGHHQTNMFNNATSQEVRGSTNTRRKGMCRVT